MLNMSIDNMEGEYVAQSQPCRTDKHPKSANSESNKECDSEVGVDKIGNLIEAFGDDGFDGLRCEGIYI